MNYITLSGGGFDHVPGAGVRLKTMGDLAEEVRHRRSITCQEETFKLKNFLHGTNIVIPKY